MAPAEATRALLSRAWAALGGEETLLSRVRITGDARGLLPSSLHALPAVAAAVASSTLAASVLEATVRDGRPAPIEIDLEHVAVCARSERYAVAHGRPVDVGFAPLSRFWRTSDGWLRLHANYSWHRDRALMVLGCDDRVDSVADAVSGWRCADLEDALAAAGAVGFAVRTPSEWAVHEQGKAVASLPLLGTLTRTTPARPRRHGPPRVLDLTRVIAGPVATRTLAAWGADVLRIDSEALPENPDQAVDGLVGKASAFLDLSSGSGRATLDGLLAQADVLVAGYRPAAVAKLGLTPSELAERHPHLSMVHLSAWGPAGPWSGRRGFDSVVQGPTGISSLEGDDEVPGALPAQVLDHATGYLSAAAALLALAATRAGEPARATQVSLAQTAQWIKGAGTAQRQTGRDLVPGPYRVTLSGGGPLVEVVRPPGRVGSRLPSWRRATALGADRPTFPSADAGRGRRWP